MSTDATYPFNRRTVGDSPSIFSSNPEPSPPTLDQTLGLASGRHSRDPRQAATNDEFTASSPPKNPRDLLDWVQQRLHALDQDKALQLETVIEAQVALLQQKQTTLPDAVAEIERQLAEVLHSRIQPLDTTLAEAIGLTTTLQRQLKTQVDKLLTKAKKKIWTNNTARLDWTWLGKLCMLAFALAIGLGLSSEIYNTANMIFTKSPAAFRGNFYLAVYAVTPFVLLTIANEYVFHILEPKSQKRVIYSLMIVGVSSGLLLLLSLSMLGQAPATTNLFATAVSAPTHWEELRMMTPILISLSATALLIRWGVHFYSARARKIYAAMGLNPAEEHQLGHWEQDLNDAEALLTEAKQLQLSLRDKKKSVQERLLAHAENQLQAALV